MLKTQQQSEEIDGAANDTAAVAARVAPSASSFSSGPVETKDIEDSVARHPGSFVAGQTAAHWDLPDETAAANRQMDVDEVDVLMAELKSEGAKRIRRRNILLTVIGIYIFAMLALTVTLHAPGLLNGIGGMTGAIIAATAATKNQKKAAALLASYRNDLRVVGPLAEALWYQDAGVAKVASEALLSLLPQMKATDRSRLTDAQSVCLYRTLQGVNVPLKLTVLKALQQIGDSRALPYLQKLAANRSELEKYPQLADEVHACVPFLTDISMREQARQQLLRASQEGLSAPDQLLRPAADTTTVDPGQLLRSTAPAE